MFIDFSISKYIRVCHYFHEMYHLKRCIIPGIDDKHIDKLRMIYRFIFFYGVALLSCIS